MEWAQIEPQLELLRELPIEPIAGLVHHGSGPRYTSLVDPLFAEKLAHFARRVAERYPWIKAFTPVNEPLTTARFSALYGHWYPHARDERTFIRALMNQLRGVVLAMRAIRQVNPEAALVQTEDLGQTHASPKLRYQAEFENERRWLTWDLLSGRVDSGHPLWRHLLWLGVAEDELAFFTAEPCPPQIIGVNHYVTSERYLDENLREHSPETHGGNGRDRYADIAAVRMEMAKPSGPEALLREVCQRYSTPVAVTEAHLGCTREEQLRWLNEIWQAAQSVRVEGHDLRAVTAWSLLGAYDWNSLLTREENHYEPGAFDLRAPAPRRTAIAQMIRALASGNEFHHPVLATPGWWRRPTRFIQPAAKRDECPAKNCTSSIVEHQFTSQTANGRPILLTGGAGRLASGFRRAAELRGLACHALTRAELDITDESAVAVALQSFAPWAVINCAGVSDPDRAQNDEEECASAHVRGAENLARACARTGARLVTFSSDFVFDGDEARAYLESDAARAINVYGQSKIAAENATRTAFDNALVIRLGKVFAPNEESDSMRARLEALARGERVALANDVRFSVSYLPDLVNATLDLLIDGESGVWHLANSGSIMPAELLFAAANLAQLETSLIDDVPVWSLRLPAPRPRNRALESERGQLLPPWENALWRYMNDSPPLTENARRVALP